ncbi:MAG: OadG family protein [Magnetococcales bacterium]|nr:OadG family protein [Magnetococcales bacterium]
MPISELILKGVELMFLGMGTVFIFLGILVFSVTKMSEIIRRYEKNRPQPEPKPGQKQSSSQSDHVAAIAAAVHRYRSTHR